MEIEHPPQESYLTSLTDFVREKWDFWMSSSSFWYPAVHIVTATIGSGVLNLESVMSSLTGEYGIIALVCFLVFSLICYSQMIQMHEIRVLDNYRRFDRYCELGQDMLGKNLGFWLVVPFQFILIIIVDIVYIITAAASLKKIFSKDSFTWPWTIGFGGFQLLLSQLPDFSSLGFVSFIGATTAIGYSTIAWIAMVAFHKPAYERQKFNAEKPNAFRAFAALGQLVFTCTAGQNIAVEIQATIPSTVQRPSKITMWKGTLVAYAIIAFCYIPVAVSGHWLYGDHLPRDCIKNFKDCHLLLALHEPPPLIKIANVMLVLHMCSGYQIYAMPLFNFVEHYLNEGWKVPTTFTVRLVVRSLYVVSTTVVATTTSPYFASWAEGAVGGIAYIPTSYLIPCILWQKHKKPRRLSLLWLGNMFCILVAIVVAITSTIGSVHHLVKEKTNHYYKDGLP